MCLTWKIENEQNQLRQKTIMGGKTEQESEHTYHNNV